mmetsp:Transcript_25877/g.65519  ORF Transcript_25877/g.65519 Transcript_25877/m.65519 type:complete len:804 (-) Transcript_25877:2083-4494(-)
MSAIEVITSKKKKITKVDPKTKKAITWTVDFWNPTIANLTLMALGSSAPEILLAVMETVSSLGAEPGELGPSTIVGSAAFNLLMISAICVVSPKSSKRISELGVFLITAFFSVFAYIWMLIVVQIWTPDEVTIAEGVITFVCFPILVLLAFFQDRSWFRKKTHTKTASGEDEEEMDEKKDFRVLGMHIEDGDGAVLHADRDQVANMVRNIRAGGHKGELTKEEEVEIAKELARKQAGSMWSKANRLMFRINASRGLAGRRRFGGGPVTGAKLSNVSVMPVNGEDSTGSKGNQKEATVSFKVPTYAALESDGTCVITIVRDGPLDDSVSVSYETQDGTATAGQDYVAASGTVRFDPGERTKTVAISIIDDNEYEPDETFEVQLKECNGCMPGKHPVTVVTIIDDDEPGVLSFTKRQFEVKESDGHAELMLSRSGGSAGKVTVEYSTNSGTAIEGKDFEAAHGIVVFEHGETQKVIKIALVDDKTPEPDHTFYVSLRNPTGGAQLSRNKTALVRIIDDDTVEEISSKVAQLMKAQAEAFKVRTTSWREQFHDAIQIAGEVDEAGEQQDPSSMDYVMHFLTIVWKVIFAIVPPTDFIGGWATFIVSLAFIGGVVVVIGEVASLFGCAIGLKDATTAITFVALGTSLPDTFASKQAAQEADDADAAIGNVTGSNSVNVFLGLGLPWMIASVYYAVSASSVLGASSCYYVPAGPLGFSVLVFSSFAIMCIFLLLLRRLPALGNGELGGKGAFKWVVAILLVFSWFSYVILSALQQYDYIDGDVFGLKKGVVGTPCGQCGPGNIKIACP